MVLVAVLDVPVCSSPKASSASICSIALDPARAAKMRPRCREVNLLSLLVVLHQIGALLWWRDDQTDGRRATSQFRFSNTRTKGSS